MYPFVMFNKTQFKNNRIGSYHLNISLPIMINNDVESIINNKISLESHLVFARLLQFMSPLIVATFSTPDFNSLYNNEILSQTGIYTKASCRLFNTTFVTICAADLNDNFPNKRTVTIENVTDNFWLKKIFRNKTFNENYKLIENYKLMTNEAYCGADFRRDTDKGSSFGFEYRILDNFDVKYMDDLLRFIVYIADFSNILIANKYKIKDEYKDIASFFVNIKDEHLILAHDKKFNEFIIEILKHGSEFDSSKNNVVHFIIKIIENIFLDIPNDLGLLDKNNYKQTIDNISTDPFSLLTFINDVLYDMLSKNPALRIYSKLMVEKFNKPKLYNLNEGFLKEFRNIASITNTNITFKKRNEDIIDEYGNKKSYYLDIHTEVNEALYDAVKADDEFEINQCLEKGAYPFYFSKKLRSSVFYLAENEEIEKLLRENMLQWINNKKNNNLSPKQKQQQQKIDVEEFIFIYQSDGKEIKISKTETDMNIINGIDNSGNSHLINAIMYHNLDAIEWLIKNGANVNYQRTYDNMTAIMYDLAHDLIFYDILLNVRDIDLSLESKEGKIAIEYFLDNVGNKISDDAARELSEKLLAHSSSKNKIYKLFVDKIIKKSVTVYPDIVINLIRILIKAADSSHINTQDTEKKYTILMGVIKKDIQTLFDTLINDKINDIDFEIKNDDGETALFEAVRSNDTNNYYLEKMLNLKTVKTVKTDIANNKGESLMKIAIDTAPENNIDKINILSQHISLNDPVDKEKNTPIVYAYKNKKYFIVEKLIEKVDVNLQNEKGENLLMLTVIDKNRYIYNKIMYNVNTNIYLKDKNDENIFMYIVKYNRDELTHFIMTLSIRISNKSYNEELIAFMDKCTEYIQENKLMNNTAIELLLKVFNDKRKEQQKEPQIGGSDIYHKKYIKYKTKYVMHKYNNLN